MSSVLARFQLAEVTRIPFWTGGQKAEATRIKLGAVQGEPFGPATPQGSIEAVIVNPEAAQVFLDAPIGQEFNILITPVEDQS